MEPFQERVFYDCDTAEITSQSGVFWFLGPPRMLFVNTPIYVVVVVGDGGGGSKYYDPDASPGAGPNRPPLDPLSRRGEIFLKTRGYPGGLLVQEILRSRHSYKVTRVDQTEARNSFGVRFLEEDL